MDNGTDPADLKGYTMPWVPPLLLEDEYNTGNEKKLVMHDCMTSFSFCYGSGLSEPTPDLPDPDGRST